VSVRGTEAAEWDKNTWPPFEDLARNHPEAGVHFQECEIYQRAKDKGSATATWFSELLSTEPWFKDVVPNVSPECITNLETLLSVSKVPHNVER
jgi:D-amino-acid oxidase